MFDEKDTTRHIHRGARKDPDRTVEVDSSAFFAPDSVICTDFSFMSMVKSLSRTRVFTNLFAETYLSLDSCPLPEMISGVLASSIRIESTSSTMAKLSGR